MSSPVPFIDIAAAADRIGFRGEALATIVAITVPESGRIADRIVPEPPSREVPENNESYGITCVNKLHVLAGRWTKEELLTLEGNLRAAWAISSHGIDFRPWMTFLNGLHVSSLDAAKVAMDHLQRAKRLQAQLDAVKRDEAQAQFDLAAARSLVTQAQTDLAVQLTRRDNALARLAEAERALIN